MAMPALPDDVIAEILIRLPQDDPSCLLRASLVCKPWLGIASAPGFRRRLRAFHPAPPMLGFLRDHCPRGPRFTATTASAFSLPAAAPEEPRGTALDCRHGRVLFLASCDLLVVWEPMTGDLRRVPTPAAFNNIYFLPNAAVVCTASGCDHRGCSTGGPFLVVFVCSKTKGGPMIIESETAAEVCVYSSETDTWNEPITIYIDSIVATKRHILVGRTLYIPFDFGFILQYDLCGRGLVVIQIPEMLLTNYKGNIMLMPTEDGKLGVAGAEGLSLSLWSREETGHGDAVWERDRVIDLDHLLPAAENMELVSFAEGTNTIFLGTDDGVFTFELKSGQLRRVANRDDSEVLLPFVSFYTPEPGTTCAFAKLTSWTETVADNH